MTKVSSGQNAVIVIGSSNTDMVIHSPTLPAPGETVLGGEFYMAAGGKGANQAVAAARAGAISVFIARVGDDVFGGQAVRGFQEEGIVTQYLVTDPDAPSGIALILVDENGENIISVAPGANGRLSTDDVHKAKDAIDCGTVAVAQLEIPIETVEHAMKLARGAGLTTILDPAPAPKQGLPRALYSLLDIIKPNETEIEILTGDKVDSDESAVAACQSLRARGVGTVILTRGAKGSLIVNEEGVTVIPARQVKAVDATAAGDAYSGALACALAEGRELPEAVRFATAAAAISVTRRGAQPSLPRRAEIEEALHQHS